MDIGYEEWHDGIGYDLEALADADALAKGWLLTLIADAPLQQAAAVPAAIKQWMLLQLGHLYEHRESASDFQVYATPFIDGLLDPYRCPVVA